MSNTIKYSQFLRQQRSLRLYRSTKKSNEKHQLDEDYKKQVNNVVESRKGVNVRSSTSKSDLYIKKRTKVVRRITNFCRKTQNNTKTRAGKQSVIRKLKLNIRRTVKSPALEHLTGKWAGDTKLCGISIVLISSDCRKKAEAAMKLRKVTQKKVDKEKRVSSDSDLDEASSIEESHSSSSDVDTDDMFEHSKKSYPLRRKSPMLSDRQRTPTRAGSASDSSSESLLDIPPPTCGTYQKWFSSNPTTPKEKERPSPVAKSPKQIEKQASTAKTGECARALRSSSSDGVGGHAQESLFNFNPKQSSPHKTAKKSIKSLDSSKSPRRSPDRERILRRDKPLSSSTPSSSKSMSRTLSSLSDKLRHDKRELEKSYSLRHLDIKSSTSTSTVMSTPKKKTGIASTIIKTAAVDKISTSPPIIMPRKKPGRPRKYPEPNVTPPIVSTQVDLPPAKRTRRTTSATNVEITPQPSTRIPRSSATEKHTTTEDSEPKKRFRRKFNDPAKQQRDAIALRARQSKIMAKSRVLQSNKYSFNASWRKQAKDRTEFDKGLSPIIVATASEDSSSAGESGSASGSGDSNTPSTSVLPDIEQPSPDITSFPFKKPKSSPVAKCEICDLTFTRKFSLTKHLATRQHQRMLRKCGVSEARKLKRKKEDKRSAPQGRGHTPVPSPDENSLFDFPQLEEADGNDNIDNEDEEEEVEVPKCIPWLSGRAVGVNRYVCDVCGDIFIKKFDFCAHLWSHREGSDLVCTDCGLKFAESDKFNEHIDQAHVVERRFSCKICPSKFNREDYLVKHLRSHKKDENDKVICSVCDKRFSTYDLLSQHFDIKHLQLGKPKVELFCDDAYSFPAHLLYERRSLALQIGGDRRRSDNNYENHDPNNVDDDEDTEYEDKDDDTPLVQHDWGRTRTLNRCRRAEISQSRNVNPQASNIQSFLQRNWLNDNSIIGCGVTSESTSTTRHSVNYSPLSCKDCGKSFESRKFLVQHVEFASHVERYVCQVCKKKFKWRYSLNRHMTRHTIEKERLKLLAKKKFSHMKHNFLKHKHRQTHSVKALPKLLQTASSSTAATVATASEFHLPPAIATNATNLQSVNVPTKNTLTAPPLLPPVPVSKPTSLTLAVKPSSLVPTTSSTPKKIPSISNKLTLTAHSDPLGPSVAGSAGDQEMPSTSATSSTIMRKTTFEPKAGQGNKFFSCELCSKSFTDKNTLTVHTWFHQSESLFSCPNCDAKCERKSDFELHFKCHETNQPFFLCYVCFKPFRWKKDMIRHVRKKHPDEKTYRCLYCNQRFRVNDELNDHIAEDHAKHRSFPCDMCGKRYAQKRYLLLHIRTQHGIESGMEVEVNPNQLLMVEVDEDAEIDQPDLDLDINISSFL